MKQFTIVTTIFLFLTSCSNPPKEIKKLTINNQEELIIYNDDNFKKLNLLDFDSLVNNICSTKAVELENIYPTIDSIASDKYENLILVNTLKARGFKVTNWGRGNWEFGPRIVSFTLATENCECQVDKLYYSTDKKGEFKVTERIRCNKYN